MDLMGLLGPLLGGIFGGLFGSPSTPQLTGPEQAAFNYDLQSARNLRKFGSSVPGSSPGEMQALAQARGILGDQAYTQQQNAYAQSNPYSQNGLGNMLTNLKGQQTASMSNLLSNFYNQAVQARQQAKFSTFPGGYPPQGYVQPTPNLAGIFGQLAQNMAYNRNLRTPSAPGAGGNYAGLGDTGSLFGLNDPTALSDAMAGENALYNANNP